MDSYSIVFIALAFRRFEMNPTIHRMNPLQRLVFDCLITCMNNVCLNVCGCVVNMWCIMVHRPHNKEWQCPNQKEWVG
jgi:hypothetical protein